jgi:hypothetical protein
MLPTRTVRQATLRPQTHSLNLMQHRIIEQLRES